MLTTTILTYRTLYCVELLVTASFAGWPTGKKDGLPTSQTENRLVYVADAPDGQRAIATALEAIGETIQHVDPWDRRAVYEGKVTNKSVHRLSPSSSVPIGQVIVIHTDAEQSKT